MDSAGQEVFGLTTKVFGDFWERLEFTVSDSGDSCWMSARIFLSEHFLIKTLILSYFMMPLFRFGEKCMHTRDWPYSQTHNAGFNRKNQFE